MNIIFLIVGIIGTCLVVSGFATGRVVRLTRRMVFQQIERSAQPKIFWACMAFWALMAFIGIARAFFS